MKRTIAFLVAWCIAFSAGFILASNSHAANRKPVVIESTGIPGQLQSTDALNDGTNPFGLVTTAAQYETSVFGDATHIHGVGPGTSGQCFMSNGAASDPSFQTCGGGGGGGSGRIDYRGWNQMASLLSVSANNAAGSYFYMHGGDKISGIELETAGNSGWSHNAMGGCYYGGSLVVSSTSAAVSWSDYTVHTVAFSSTYTVPGASSSIVQVDCFVWVSSSINLNGGLGQPFYSNLGSISAMPSTEPSWSNTNTNAQLPLLPYGSFQ